jgi:hypothetical protein
MKDLMSADGGFASYRTIHKFHVDQALNALREFLSCNVIAVKCDAINGDHDWMIFRLPIKHHTAARAFLKGWERGVSDGLDRHYGRKSQAELVAKFKENNPELA